MKKIGILVFCLIFAGLLLPAQVLYAAQSQIVTRTVFDAEDFKHIDANLPASLLHVRIHQEDHVLVTFEVIREFERGNRPQFEFDNATGTLYITQEPYANTSFGSSMNISSDGNITNWIMNIRTQDNFSRNNRQIIANGQIVDLPALRAIEDVTLIDTGLVTVYVPEGFVLDVLNFESGNNRMAVFGENSITIREVSANVANGSISINGAYLHDIDLTVSNGSLSLINSAADGNISMRSSNGSVSISNSRITAAPHLQVSNGIISLRDSVFTADFTTQASNGSLTWNNVTAERNATARVTNGSMSISNSRINGQFSASASSGTINMRSIDTDMDRADISAGRHGRVFLDGRRID